MSLQVKCLSKAAAAVAAVALMSPAFIVAQSPAAGSPTTAKPGQQPVAQPNTPGTYPQQPGTTPLPQNQRTPDLQNQRTPNQQLFPGQAPPTNPQGAPGAMQPGQGIPNTGTATPGTFPGSTTGPPNFTGIGNPAAGNPFAFGQGTFPNTMTGGFYGIPSGTTGTPNTSNLTTGVPNPVNPYGLAYLYGLTGGSSTLFNRPQQQGTMPNAQPLGMMTTPPNMPEPALISIRVPEQATVYVQGHQLPQSGPERQLVTPVLSPGAVQSYVIQAVWQQDGRQVGARQVVDVLPGDHKSVTFISGQPLNQHGR